MRRPDVVRTLLSVVAVCAVVSCVAYAQPQEKKLIEYGWDVPKPSFVAENIREMEKRPFEGLIMRVPNIGSIFRNAKWDEAEVAGEFQALERIQWGTFTDNFVIMYAASTMDWFSDADWECVLHNIGLCAKAARLGRCKGLCFDAEPYGDNPWHYPTQAHADEKTFAEYQQIARQRGAQFMDRIEQEMEAPIIHTFFLMGYLGGLALEPDPAERDRKLSEQGYGLLPAFANGMLDAADPGTIITDGNEGSYYYTSDLQYLSAFHVMKQVALGLVAPENRAKYRAQVQAAHALYVDHLFDLRTRKFISQYMTPEERARWFEHNVYHALRTSDCYVWLYSEKMNWWTNTDLPPGLPEAVVAAKGKLSRREPLGFDIEEIIKRAEQRQKEELQASLIKRQATIAKIAEGTQPPTIDAELGDACWEKATRLEQFVPYVTIKDASLQAQTLTAVAYDDTSLYVSVYCQEPQMDRLKIVGAKRDDSVWLGDSVDLFVAPGPERVPFYHIIINPDNVQWDARHQDILGDLSWSPEYQSATRKAGDNWTLELAVPWAAMGMPAPAAGATVFANLGRQRPAARELSTWSQCIGGFVEADSFGIWTFE